MINYHTELGSATQREDESDGRTVLVRVWLRDACVGEERFLPLVTNEPVAALLPKPSLTSVLSTDTKRT